MAALDPLHDLSFRLSTGDALDVRTFKVEERMNSPFVVELTARSPNPDLDLEGFIGEAGRFEIPGRRAWTGIVRTFEQMQAEPAGLSTYRIELVPLLWLLTQRRNHRIFQRVTEPEMAMKVLEDWKVPFEQRIDQGAYRKRDYRVQYAESDFSFLSRMLEDAGIAYFFDTVGEDSILVLSDAPHSAEPRLPIEHVDDASAIPPGDFVSKMTLTREIRPGKYTVRDVDFRLPPTHPLLFSSSASAKAIENDLESFHYVPGAFLFEGQGDGTPNADDKLAARSHEREAELLARRRLDAKRSEAQTYRFRTNALDLKPGSRVGVTGHPHSNLSGEQPLLVTHIVLEGEANKHWSMTCHARRSDVPFRPALATPKPRVPGVEMATVVGPAGEEIHTDEFGRVRVHFHWDRQSKMNDDSSCWVPVNQPWAGAGYGGSNLPRIGQEVFVDFVGGDPDRPVILGRVYTASQPVPYKLPDNKTQSGWRSSSTTNTGGYNEVMFEDLAGKELLRMQAEKDLHKIVKNDEECTVGNDRTREVKNDESVTVGNDRTVQIGANERISIGQNQTITVGVNRTTQIGVNDSMAVGDTYLVKVASSASLTMSSQKLVFDTGAGAQIIMDTDKITLKAATIVLEAKGVIDAHAGKGIAITSPEGTNVVSGKIVTLAAKELKLGGDDAQLTGEKLKVGATGKLEITGLPVEINGPGFPAARMTDPVFAQPTGVILAGSPTVFIGSGGAPPPRPDQRRYATADEAAAAAMKYYNPISGRENLEYGGWIEKNADGTFTPHPATQGTVDGLSNIPDKGANDVAWWHTHGAADPRFDSEHFSGNEGDKGFSRQNGTPGYVATPSGAMRRYNPSTGKVTDLPGSAPQ